MKVPNTVREYLPLLPLAGPFSFLYTVVFSPAGLTAIDSGDKLALEPCAQSLICMAWMTAVAIAAFACPFASRHWTKTALAQIGRFCAIALPLSAAVCALSWHEPFAPLAVSLLLGTGCVAQLPVGARVGADAELAHMACGTSLALLLAAGVNCMAVMLFAHALYGTVFIALFCAACGIALVLLDISAPEEIADATDSVTPNRLDIIRAQDNHTSMHIRDTLLLRYDWQPLVGGMLCALCFGLSWNEPAADINPDFAPILLIGKAAGALSLVIAFLRLGSKPNTKAFDYTVAIAVFSALAFWLFAAGRSTEPALFVLASYSQVLFIGLLWVETSCTGRDLEAPEVLPLAGVSAFLGSYVIGGLLGLVIDASISTACVPVVFLVFAFVLHIRALRSQNQEIEEDIDLDRSFESVFAEMREMYGLSQREGEILPLLVLGLSANVIGERLFISPQTAKSHAHRIYVKMGIHSHDELVTLFESRRDAAVGPSHA